MFETLQLRRIFWYFVKNVVFWLSCFCHLCEVFFFFSCRVLSCSSAKFYPQLLRWKVDLGKQRFELLLCFNSRCLTCCTQSLAKPPSTPPSLPSSLPPFCLLCFFLSLIHCCFPPQCCPTLQSKFSVMCTVLYVTLLSLLICYFNSCGSAAQGGCFTIRCCFWSPFKI